MRVSLGNVIATVISTLIGIAIALLFSFGNLFFARFTIPLIILAVIALVAIILVVLVMTNGLSEEREKEARAISEHGFFLAIAAILTLLFIIIAFFVSFRFITIFTFILILFGGAVIALMFISLFRFIFHLIRLNCKYFCK